MTEHRNDALRQHAAECEDCGAAPLDALAATLRGAASPVDAARLSSLTLARLAPVLQEQARKVFWRRVAVALAAALLPLPLVVAADIWLLGWLYSLIAAWLPEGVALYVVATCAAWLLIMIGSAYAAIPLLLARILPPPQPASMPAAA